ncbi:hypothetical protein SGRIM119S_01812 [Streptomyces griseorubiginosus]
MSDGRPGNPARSSCRARCCGWNARWTPKVEAGDHVIAVLRLRGTALFPQVRPLVFHQALRATRLVPAPARSHASAGPTVGGVDSWRRLPDHLDEEQNTDRRPVGHLQLEPGSSPASGSRVRASRTTSLSRLLARRWRVSVRPRPTTWAGPWSRRYGHNSTGRRCRTSNGHRSCGVAHLFEEHHSEIADWIVRESGALRAFGRLPDLQRGSGGVPRGRGVVGAPYGELLALRAGPAVLLPPRPGRRCRCDRPVQRADRPGDAGRGPGPRSRQRGSPQAGPPDRDLRRCGDREGFRGGGPPQRRAARTAGRERMWARHWWITRRCP